MMQPFGGPWQTLNQNDPFDPQFNAMYNVPQPGGGPGMQPGAPLGNNATQQLGRQQQGVRQNRSPSHFSETSQDLRDTAMMEDFFDHIEKEKGAALSKSEQDNLLDVWLNSMRTPSTPVWYEADACSSPAPVQPEADARLPPTPTPVKSEAVDSPHTAPAGPPGMNEREPALSAMNEASGSLSPVKSTPTSSTQANDAPQKSPD